MAATQFSYVEAGRLNLIDLAATAPGSSFTETHTYHYDSANRVANHWTLGESVDFTYDDGGQLTAEDGEMGSFDRAYRYDGKWKPQIRYPSDL